MYLMSLLFLIHHCASAPSHVHPLAALTRSPGPTWASASRTAPQTPPAASHAARTLHTPPSPPSPSTNSSTRGSSCACAMRVVMHPNSASIPKIFCCTSSGSYLAAKCEVRVQEVWAGSTTRARALSMQRGAGARRGQPRGGRWQAGGCRCWRGRGVFGLHCCGWWGRLRPPGAVEQSRYGRVALPSAAPCTHYGFVH